MAKKLDDIKREIELSAIPFRNYLKKELNKDLLCFLSNISVHYDVYIFSGIIRDYFLKRKNIRDIDIVVDGDFNLEKFIKDYTYKKNSFGGFKVNIGNIAVDLWNIKDTWALNFEKRLEFDLNHIVPRTAFFNFSSILYSYNEKKFIYTSHFIKFLRDKKIDVVYKPNPNNALCVVNSLYYNDTLHLKLGETLKNHIKIIYKNNFNKYKETQIRHFGKLLYSNNIIKKRVEEM